MRKTNNPIENRGQASKQVGKVKKATLVISLIVGLAFSIIIGVTAGAMGLVRSILS